MTEREADPREQHGSQGHPEQQERDGGRDRASTLAAAILEISANLDLDTVVRKVVEQARSLTGARRGIIATVEESGAPGEYFFSGYAPEEERELLAWPHGLQLFEHFRELPGPLRQGDFADYARALGLTPLPSFSGAFLGTPMRHRGENVGYFFLGDKAENEAFTDADEEMLVLFAWQAAAAIANARAHRGEQRVRRDLETLIETSPVGVVVFDGQSGKIVSSNREARRIVESLRTPGHPLEQLLEVVICRRADGQEVSLAELPLALQFASPETVRAEEIVLSVPDGRSVRTLINATPTRPEGAGTGSVVATLQDLAPLDEIERMRTEFLGLVSHELRAPLTAIKGSAVTLLEDPAGLDPAEMREFFRIIVEQADQMRGLITDLLDTGRIASGTLSVSPEPSAAADLVEQARSTFLTGGSQHGIVVDLADGLPPVMADRRRIVQVLNNLLANAARHAPVSTVIRVAVVREAGQVAFSVADDGAGVEPDLLPNLFHKHVGGAGGTASQGLGLAICKGLVEAHGGRIRATSDGPGQGTTITFTMPVAAPADGTASAPVGRPASAKPGERPRILVVDDDPRMLRFVRDTLTKAGYAPLVTGASEDLAGLIRAEQPKLVLLDLLLPGRDGIELLEEIPELSDLPVIFISGYGRDETIARAFEQGADDYIVKPFSPTELVARIRAALRRHREPEKFVLGELAIEYERHRVTVGGEAVELTNKEFELLRLLSINAGRVVHHDTLLRRIWEARPGADANLIRIFVRNLRRKLGDSAENPTWIFNQRGVGYRMPRPGER